MDLRRPPRRYSAWTLRLARCVEWTAALLFGRRLYARRLRPGRLRLRRVDVPIAGLPAPFDGFRIAHVSDLHAGPFLDAASLEPVVDLAAAARPDLLAVTGDLITHGVEDGLPLAAPLGRIRARHGGVLVFGNHDYRARREGELAAAFSAHGIRALRNEGFALERDGARLFVAGLEDVEEGKVVDLDAALAGRAAGETTLLLAHHPETGRGVDLVLSGHTHGGQIVVAGRPLLRGFDGPTLEGLHDVPEGETRVFVTTGLGVLVVPFRVGAPPEVALLTLRRSGTLPRFPSAPKDGPRR
ncbi:MAG: metallophosphoesterase [Planctomycetota bacterium JB042]